KLGIAQDVNSKLILDAEPGQPQRNVAEGKADIVVTAIPEILSFDGVELAGPLPGQLQSYIDFAAAVGTKAQSPMPAKALIKFMTGPAAASALKMKGLEPAVRRRKNRTE